MSEQYRLSMEAALDQWKKAASQQGEKIITLQSDLQTLRDERDRLRTFLDEALEEWEYSCQYKSEYLREKHGDLERIAEIKAALTPAGGQERANDSHIG